MINDGLKKIIVIGIGLTTLLSVLCVFIEPWCALICLILGITLTLVFFYYTKKRYDSIAHLNDYLSLILSGVYDLDISDNSEGELSMMKNNLFKVMTLLDSQNNMLKKDKIYLSDSLADISHQLKTPLTSMMVMTELIKDEEDNEKRTQFLSVIESQLDKMKWLILTLLKLSKLDAGTADFKKDNVSIKNIIDKSIKQFLITIDIKGIDIINNIEDFTFTGDENWTVEAVENIIKNCIEHLNKNGRIEISTYCTNIYNSLIIKDNGTGISQEDLPHIFERFYHGENSSSDSVGIGLALAKTIFEKENAQISVTSTAGEGSAFEIRFYKAIV